MTNVSNESVAAASGTFMLGGDLPVYRLGFGAMRITGKGIWGEPADRDLAIRVVKRTVDLGINFIDTADSYGPKVSEEIIAEALYPYPSGLVIATKGGQMRSGPNQWSPNGRPEHLREALDGSLRRLRLDCIDLYQLHRPDPSVPFEESVETLADLRKQGKIRHVGLSNIDTKQLEMARAMVPIASVQNRYNLTERDSEDVLAMCGLANIGFIPWGPVANGNLTGAGSSLERIAQAHHATTTQIALAWLLQHSSVMLPIPGTSSLEHLEENTKAARIDLSQEDIEQLDQLA